MRSKSSKVKESKPTRSPKETKGKIVEAVMLGDLIPGASAMVKVPKKLARYLTKNPILSDLHLSKNPAFPDPSKIPLKLENASVYGDCYNRLKTQLEDAICLIETLKNDIYFFPVPKGDLKDETEVLLIKSEEFLKKIRDTILNDVYIKKFRKDTVDNFIKKSIKHK